MNDGWLVELVEWLSGCTAGWKDVWMEGRLGRQMAGWLGVWMDGGLAGWLGGLLMDRWLDGRLTGHRIM